MTTQRIVSIYMMTYKRPYYLKTAIESVLRQTFTDFDLTILDNQSKDETEVVAKSFCDNRIKYIEHGGNNFSYAFLINKSKSRYIVVLHDDDVLCETYLEKMIAVMESNPT